MNRVIKGQILQRNNRKMAFSFHIFMVNSMLKEIGKSQHDHILSIPVIIYSYLMPVCSIVKTITPRCCGRPDALLQEAKCNIASGRRLYRGVIV